MARAMRHRAIAGLLLAAAVGLTACAGGDPASNRSSGSAGTDGSASPGSSPSAGSGSDRTPLPNPSGASPLPAVDLPTEPSPRTVSATVVKTDGRCDGTETVVDQGYAQHSGRWRADDTFREHPDLPVSRAWDGEHYHSGGQSKRQFTRPGGLANLWYFGATTETFAEQGDPVPGPSRAGRETVEISAEFGGYDPCSFEQGGTEATLRIVRAFAADDGTPLAIVTTVVDSGFVIASEESNELTEDAPADDAFYRLERD